MTKENIFQEALNELKQKRLKAELKAKHYKQWVYENIPGAKELFNELTDLKIKKAKAEIRAEAGEKDLKELDAEIEETKKLLKLECEKIVSADKVDNFLELLETENVRKYFKLGSNPKIEKIYTLDNSKDIEQELLLLQETEELPNEINNIKLQLLYNLCDSNEMQEFMQIIETDEVKQFFSLTNEV